MSEPIRDVETAVRELGALPVPVGVKPLAAEGPARTMLDHAREALNARMLKDDLRLVLENVITYAAERQAENEQLRAEVDQAHDNLIGANLSLYEEEQETARLRLALESARRGRRGLRAQVAALLEERHRTNEWADDAAKALRADRDRIAELEARLAEFERPADEDPIALSLTTKADVFVPRTERERWAAIADALNAAHAAGMPVGIDLDGTLTDHRMWSVVWDRAAERWTVAGYEDDAEQAAVAKLRALLAGQREQAGGES